MCVVQADMHGGTSISSCHVDGEGARSRIWGQALQYIDEVPVEKVGVPVGIQNYAPSFEGQSGAAAKHADHQQDPKLHTISVLCRDHHESHL